MRKYVAVVTFLFLFLVAAGLHGESGNQRRLNTTLMAVILSGGGISLGIGGAVGFSFSPRLELEQEAYYVFSRDPHYYSVSTGLLGNFEIGNKGVFPYILGGFSILGERRGSHTYLMFGGGMKWDIKSYMIRFDLRVYLGEGGPWMKFSTGLMWSF